MKKPSFNFYESFGDVINSLRGWKRERLFWVIFNYGIYGILPDEDEDEEIISAFSGHIKCRLDEGWKSYENWLIKNNPTKKKEGSVQ